MSKKTRYETTAHPDVSDNGRTAMRVPNNAEVPTTEDSAFRSYRLHLQKENGMLTAEIEAELKRIAALSGKDTGSDTGSDTATPNV